MKSKALLIALAISLFSPSTPAIAAEPKVAIAYDLGFLGDNSFNDAVHLALKAAKKHHVDQAPLAVCLARRFGIDERPDGLHHESALRSFFGDTP